MSSDGPAPGGPVRAPEAVPGTRPLRILLIDDDRRIAEALRVALRLAGHVLEVAIDPEEGLGRLATTRPDLVLLDLNYGPGRSDGAQGLALLHRLAADDPALPVVVVTAHSGVRVAVAALRAGARDFVMKPWRNAELLAKLEAAAWVPRLGSAGPGTPPCGPAVHLLGDSAAMAAVRDLVRRIGPTAADVLVTGSPGAGRTLAAQAIHAASADTAPLVRVDLGGPEGWQRLPDLAGTALLRGADMLDAVDQRRLCELLPVRLRCLSIVDRPDALGAPLRRRLGTVELAVPPLAARREDAALLARHFARTAAGRHGRPTPRFTPAAERLLATGPWPDEVRGLSLAVERAVLLAPDGVIDAALLAPPVMAPPAAPVVPAFDLDATQKAVITAALRAHGHNVTHAAAALGLSRGALYRRMAQHGL